jgi:hypothetical protein
MFNWCAVNWAQIVFICKTKIVLKHVLSSLFPKNSKKKKSSRRFFVFANYSRIPYRYWFMNFYIGWNRIFQDFSTFYDSVEWI